MQDPKIVQKRIGEYVRYLREKRGWSQRVLSEKAGLSKSFTGAVERGEADICVGTVCKLALAFDLRLAELWETADDWSPGNRPEVTGHRLQGKNREQGQKRGNRGQVTGKAKPETQRKGRG